ncbi:ABC transporter permease [Clostridium botulinum]|uniref:ABC transporter permease n=1 Tax=Clostridium botulinum TaxID=1491 RepID=UPI001A9281F9|nr:ABC transporter permease [Clostridium botulinum]MBO0526079.1 ABC transporter permease [Clostridium botulinum]MBO0526851.1 ABC transporter permease [Clostridium botulinum]MBO0531983.1 ABC transporter permease [Clostridium botulinum]MBO0538363.1 ABC transporter permease [Clostridium botulinum]MBO0541078.1 ABC transporter permease [Clostridium botulinum]
MGLFNIAFKNVKRNFKNYAMYLISMIFSVFIYSMFKAIEYNNQIANVADGMKTVSKSFSGASAIIALFVFIFIWYSNSFFIKKRKKEMGLYSVLGIKKKSIAAMMFYETMTMGIIALVIGIFLGAFFSKGFILVFFKFIDAENIVNTGFSIKALVSTIKTFILIYFVVSISGSSIIYRYELIDLFTAESKREKEPKASKIKSVLSLIFLLSGYGLYIISKGKSLESVAMITLTTVVIGTYLFFSSFTVYYLKVKRNNKKIHFKGLNMISNSQLLYRIKGNSRTLATITILIATTLTASGASISFYKYFSANMDKEMPFDYVVKAENNKVTNDIDKLIKNNSKNKLKEKIDITVLQYENKSSDIYDSKSILSEKDFNKIAKAKNIEVKDKINSSKEAYYFPRFLDKKNKILNVNISEENFKIVHSEERSLANMMVLDNVLIVRDDEFIKLQNQLKKEKYALYLVQNHNRSGKLTKDFNSIITNYEKSKNDPKYRLINSNYYENYRENISSSGTMLFIGCFVGLVFLVCTVSIIFFKQLSEAMEEKYRYKILRNIGVRNKELKSSIYKQMEFIFFVPLIVGIAHGGVALSIFGKFLNLGILTPITMVAIPYTIVYLIYYFLTVEFYYKAIS